MPKIEWLNHNCNLTGCQCHTKPKPRKVYTVEDCLKIAKAKVKSYQKPRKRIKISEKVEDIIYYEFSNAIAEDDINSIKSVECAYKIVKFLQNNYRRRKN